MTDIFLGLIILWSTGSATIPEGWNICDGTNGTPDLRGLFPYGKADDVDTPVSGGSSVHSHVGGVSSTYANHSHSFSVGIGNSSGTSTEGGASTSYAAGGHSHSVNSSSLSSTAPSHSHMSNLAESSSLPPYSYAYYIMKVA